MYPLLVLAGIYGLSGSLLKLVYSGQVYSFELQQSTSEEGGSDIPRFHRVDLEASRVVADHLAFTLIGSGFALGIIAELDVFPYTPLLVSLLVIFQNIIIWLTALYLGPVNRTGTILYKGAPSVLFPTLAFAIFPGLISWSLDGRDFIPVSVPIWFIPVPWALMGISAFSLISMSRFVNRVAKIKGIN